MPTSPNLDPAAPTVRVATPSDRPFLMDVLRLSALATYPQLGSLGRLSLRDALEACYADYDRPAKRVWIAEAAGVPAAGLWGLHSVHPVLEEAEFLIVAIATLPDHRGRGLARALLGRAAEAARQEGARALRLFANPDNSSAMTLYRLQGFTPLTVELRNPLA